MEEDSSIGSIILSLIVALILLTSASAKIFQLDPTVQMFSQFGLLNFIFLIGLLELILAILLVIPATTSIAAFFLSAFFGGAVAIHLANNQLLFAAIPAILILVIWVAAFLQNPETFRS